MSKTSIKVQYVNQPKSPKGPGNIKTDNGVYYKVWTHSKDGGATLAQFEAGKTYEIEYDTEQYQGTDRFVARKILSSSESVATSSSNGHTPVASNGSTSTDKQILWQVCLKAAGQVLTGTGTDAAQVLAYARAFYSAVPEIATVVEQEEAEVEI